MNTLKYLLLIVFCIALVRGANSQTPSNRYGLYNKTKCYINMTAHSNSGTTSTVTLAPDDSFSNTFPTNEYLCYVDFTFPDMALGSSNLNSEYPSPTCLSPIEYLPSSICYAGNADWTIHASGYISFNIF